MCWGFYLKIVKQTFQLHLISIKTIQIRNQTQHFTQQLKSLSHSNTPEIHLQGGAYDSRAARYCKLRPRDRLTSQTFDTLSSIKLLMPSTLLPLLYSGDVQENWLVRSYIGLLDSMGKCLLLATVCQIQFVATELQKYWYTTWCCKMGRWTCEFVSSLRIKWLKRHNLQVEVVLQETVSTIQWYLV